MADAGKKLNTMKKLSPIKAKTEKQVCSLKRDNIMYGDFGIMLSRNDIFLDEQKRGESRKQGISIPRKYFDKLIAWYQKEQTIVNRED